MGKRVSVYWANTLLSIGKGSLAIADQGLISGSNFLISVLLARWLVPEQYGSYGVAFSIFLLFSLFHQALLLEPMSVFGPALYQDFLKEYLGAVLWIHGAIALVIVVALGLSAWMAHQFARSEGLAVALLGVTFASPCILLFWLARRVLYVKLAPQGAVIGALLYSSVLLGGLLLVYRWRSVTPLLAFLLMALGGLTTGFFLLAQLKSALRFSPSYPDIREVSRRHWSYGRWALASALVAWIPWEIYYTLLSGFSGMAASGVMKALSNLALPVGQVFIAISLFCLPLAASRYARNGSAVVKVMTWKLTALFAGGAVTYWALLFLWRAPIVHFLYGGSYAEVVSLIPWIAPASVLWSAAYGPALALRAMQSPFSVFLVYCASSAVAVVIGIPATWEFGLRGAVFSLFLSSFTALTVGALLVAGTPPSLEPERELRLDTADVGLPARQ